MTPNPNEADRNFLAYQETSSPRYLARVFDLVAGELLLLASHLSRDPHTAEDLVQATFVEAIKCAQRFELRSGVKQWLVGILANQAKLEWRRRGRKLDPDRVRADKAVDPDFEVEAREFQDALKHAMAALPSKYREVLRLSLFHDLSSTEIAQALERPRETVKSQVRRGLAMLQKAMPQSLALGALVTMLPGRGLAQMKLSILAEAEAAQAAAQAAALAAKAAASGVDPAGGFGSWAAWGGGGAGKKIVAAALVATVVAVGAWQLWPEGGRGLDRVAETESRVGDGDSDRDKDTRVVGAGADQRSVLAVPGSKERDNNHTDPDRATGELLVNVRFAADGAAAAGAAVSVRPAEETTWLKDRVATTDAAGSVRFVGLAPGQVQILGGRGGKAAAEVLAGGQAAAELSIPPGIELRGIVRDKAGKPLGGVPIYLSPPDHGLDFGVEILKSDVDGRFVIRDVEPRRGIAVYAPGRVGPRPRYLQRRPDDAAQPGQPDRSGHLVLQFRGPGARIRGVARGPDGEPAVGAAVMIGWSFPPRLGDDLPCYPLRTDARGAFFAPGVVPAYDLPVWVKGPDGTAVWRGIVKSLAPGQEGFVQVDLKRGARVKGVVHKDGEPVAGILVEALQDDVEEGPGFKFAGPAWARVRTRSGADGSFVLENIHPGGGKLSASDPQRPELGQARQAFELLDGATFEWHPSLTKGLSILGRVVDERGTPIPGFRVKLMGPKHTEDRILYSAADGTFEFDALEDIPYTLTMADKDPVIRNLAVFFEDVRPGPEVRDFPIGDVARASCYFTGTVVGPEGLPVQGLRISLVHEQDGTRKAAEARGLGYRQGRFRVGPVPPAAYHVFARAKDLELLYLGRFHAHTAGQTIDTGTARFQAPGYLSVRVKDPDGRPTALPFLDICLDGSPAGTRLPLRTGRCVRHRLAPGVYWLEHWSFHHVPFLARVEVKSGQNVDLDVQLRNGAGVAFHLPPVPLVGTALELALYRIGEAGKVGKAGNGRLVHRQHRIYGHTTAVANTLAMEPGRYRLVVTNVAGQQAETRFTVTAGRATAGRATADAKVQQVDVRFPGAE